MIPTNHLSTSEIDNINEDANTHTSSDIFFDENSDFYGNVTLLKSDLFFIDFIKKQNNVNKSFLDIGGGSGIFASHLKRDCGNINIAIVDPSLKMLGKNCDKSIVKYQGQLPDKLNIPFGDKFDYILIKEVLHHVTGKSIKECKELVIESLQNTKKLLLDDGYLMVHELFYESYFHTPFTRTCIFYLLKLQNAVRFKILPKEFILGLTVCFYTKAELELFFQNGGFEIVDSYEMEYANNFKKKGLFLRKWGRILYILKKSSF